MVRLFPPIAPTVNLNPFTSPIVAAQVPVPFAFAGSATSPQAPISVVQYKVEGGEFANAINVSGNWSQFRIILPLPPTAGGPDHTLTVRAIDTFGTTGEISKPFAVQPDPPIVVPPGADTTFSGAPTTSSITSWTRLEPQCTDADIGTSSSARVFDPLWLLTRQWQMGEFQAEDAGTPIQARVRATTRDALPALRGRAAEAGHARTSAVAAQRLRPAEHAAGGARRAAAACAPPTRPTPACCTFAVEAGLHFLRMLELQTLSKSYRPAFITKLALQPLADASSALVDDATSRYLQSMVGRAPDGRQLAVAAAHASAPRNWLLDPALNIAVADRPKVQQAATRGSPGTTRCAASLAGPTDDAWNPPRLEYALSVGARLSANPGDEMTFSAAEIDGPIDWSSFDVNTQACSRRRRTRASRRSSKPTIPAPVTFPGAPAPRFWEMEDARIAYGLVPVGPTDLAQLLMIEYASSYGNDWFVVPLTLPVGSVTRVDSLVVTDTFGVRSLIRPIGDPALPPAHFSLWQPALKNARRSARRRLPRTASSCRRRSAAPSTARRSRTCCSCATRWPTWPGPSSAPSRARSSSRRSATKRPMRRPSIDRVDPAVADLPRYLLSTQVPPNWIPLLPVQVPNPAFPNTAGQILSRLKRGAVLQPDGSQKVHTATGEVLLSIGDQLLYDEEVPREGARITRQRRLARWTDGSTWLWTSFRNQVGTGEGSSQLKFDQVLER